MVGAPRPTLILAGIAFVAVAFATISLILTWEWWGTRRRRAQARTRLTELMAAPGAGAASGVLKTVAGPGATWVQLAGRMPHLSDIETILRQGGVTWTLQTYILLMTGCALAFGLAALTLTHQALTSLVVAVIGGTLPYLYARRQRSKRLDAFESRLPETIDLLGRAIRAGHPMSAGIKMVADESLPPIGEEFLRVFEEQRYGLPFEDSLLAMAERVPLVDVRILITAIVVQRQVGGNLAEILDSLSYTIRARFMIRRQLRTHTAQGRLSGYVLGALPLVVGLGLFMVNPTYIGELFTDPLGKFLVGVGLVFQLAGFFWIRHIVNIQI